MDSKLRQKSISNLLEQSNEKELLEKAKIEWQFSGNMEDYGDAIEECQLCEKGGIRYHFEIENKVNKSKMQVGSSCIEKFDIAVYDEDGKEVLKGKDGYLKKLQKETHVEEKVDELLKNGVIKNITGVYGESYSTKDLDLKITKSYNRDGKFNPKELNYLFKRFDSNNIEYNPTSFKINLSDSSFIEQLENLNQKQFNRIKKSLSTAQLKKYNS